MREEMVRENEDMVEALIRRYTPLVYAMARRMCPGRPRDEDLLQCGLIGLWHAAERWDGVRPFAPLARRCVQGEMADYLRRQSRQLPTVPLEHCPDLPVWEDDHSALELREAALAGCPAGSRQQALLLAIADGQELPQAARALGLRPSRARAMVRRAARRLGYPENP